MISAAEEIYNKTIILVNEGKDILEVYPHIESEFGYSIDYVDTLFIRRYKMTFRSFVKNAVLIRAFEYWKKHGCPNLTTRTKICNICNFKKKFIRAFDTTPEEANETDMDMAFYLPNNELSKLLDESPIIKDYKRSSGEYLIKLDFKQLLIYYMSTPVYIFPKETLDETNLLKLDINARKILIIILDRVKNDYKDDSEPDITIPVEELEIQLMMMDKYNIDCPRKLHGHYIFSINIDDNYYSIFEEIIDDIMPYMTLNISNSIMDHDENINKLYDYFISSDFFSFNIKSLSDYFKIKKEEMIKILWDYVTLGLIRFEYGFIPRKASEKG